MEKKPISKIGKLKRCWEDVKNVLSGAPEPLLPWNEFSKFANQLAVELQAYDCTYEITDLKSNWPQIVIYPSWPMERIKNVIMLARDKDGRELFDWVKYSFIQPSILVYPQELRVQCQTMPNKQMFQTFINMDTFATDIENLLIVLEQQGLNLAKGQKVEKPSIPLYKKEEHPRNKPLA